MGRGANPGFFLAGNGVVSSAAAILEATWEPAQGGRQRGLWDPRLP